MNIKLQFQKVQMLTAINYLDLIEVCDENIRLGNKPENYKLKKQEYVDRYANAISNIVLGAIKLSKMEITY